MKMRLDEKPKEPAAKKAATDERAAPSENAAKARRLSRCVCGKRHRSAVAANYCYAKRLDAD